MGLFGDSRLDALEQRLFHLERVVARMAPVLGLEAPPDREVHRIREAVQAGHKLEAIRLYRERSGVGLAEAKDAIERGTWEQDLRVRSAA